MPVSHQVGLVVCGAPLAARASEVATALMDEGRSVSIVATPAALAWIDTETVAQVVGHAPLVDNRTPDEPKRRSEPDALVICPLTFNSLNKIVAGIADTYAHGVMCAALGQRVPVIAVPMVNEILWGHPAWSANLEAITNWGVKLLDVRTGDAGARAVPSGIGADVVARFDPTWVRAALDSELAPR
jgi:phosphopantothenoylcysteine synthetase/decarboxylase